MIHFPKKYNELSQDIKKIYVRKENNYESIDKVLRYNKKTLDYRTLFDKSSFYYCYRGNQKNDYISTNLNDIYIRWKNKVVIILENSNLIDGEEINIYPADVSEEVHDITITSGSSNEIIINNSITLSDTYMKFVYITDNTSNEYGCIYKITDYISSQNKIILLNNLNHNITVNTQAKIIRKKPDYAKNYFWQNVKVYDNYTDMVSALGTDKLGIFNEENIANYTFPPEIIKTNSNLFYAILDNTFLKITNSKFFLDINDKDILMDSDDVFPGKNLFDIINKITDIQNYENTSLLFNEIDKKLTNWLLYDYHTGKTYTFSDINSIFTNNRYYIDVSVNFTENTSFYLVYIPYLLVYKGDRLNNTTIRFDDVSIYNYKGDITNLLYFSKYNMNGHDLLLADYLRMNRNFIILPTSQIFLTNTKLIFKNFKLYFLYSSLTQSDYNTEIDISTINNNTYIIYARIKTGSSNNYHIISEINIIDETTYTTNRKTTYGDSIIIGIYTKQNSTNYLTLYGKLLTDLDRVVLKNQTIDNSIEIGDSIIYDNAQNKWINVPLGEIPIGICENAGTGNNDGIVVLSGLAYLPITLTVNTEYYVSNINAGEPTTSKESEIYIFRALTSDYAIVNIHKNTQNNNIKIINSNIDSSIVIGNAISYDDTNNKWIKTVAGNIPVAIYGGNNKIIIAGKITGLTGLSVGKYYYTHTGNDGEIVDENDANKTNKRIGYAISATELIVNIDVE